MNHKWELVDWDGNLSLKLKCWRKKFRHGYVSIGVGDYLNVTYSYGANSEDSIGSTRWNYGVVISEKDMMAFVDSNFGKHKSYPPKPGQYKKWFNSLDKTTQDAVLSVGQSWYNLCLEKHNKLMLT